MKTMFSCAAFLCATVFGASVTAAPCADDSGCAGAQVCREGECVEPGRGSDSPTAAESENVGAEDNAAQSTESPTGSEPAAPSTGEVASTPAPAAATASTQPSPEPARVEPSPAAVETAAGAPEQARETEDENRFRLDLGMSVLRVRYMKESESDSAGTTWITAGPSGTVFGLGLGAAIKGHISVGARVTAAVATRAGADIDSSYVSFDYQLLPYFEYAFGNGKIKPFIQVNLGLGGYIDSSEDDTGDNGYRESQLQFLFGVAGGAHFFFGNRASFDLGLLDMLGFGKNKSTYTYSGGSDSESEEQIFTNTLTLFIGATIWI